MRYENRRKYIRLRAYHLAKYRAVSDDNKGGAFTVASIRDIGAGGVCILTEDHIPLGTLLELNINFPAITTSVFALAKVVWVKEIRKIKRYEIGAQFVQINDSMRVLIDGQVQRVCNNVKKPSR